MLCEKKTVSQPGTASSARALDISVEQERQPHYAEAPCCSGHTIDVSISSFILLILGAGGKSSQNKHLLSPTMCRMLPVFIDLSTPSRGASLFRLRSLGQKRYIM